MTLTRQSVEESVKEVISRYVDVAPEKIKPSSSLKDIGADSLTTVELVMALEEKFSVEIPDKDLEKIKTVDDLIDLIIAIKNSRKA